MQDSAWSLSWTHLAFTHATATTTLHIVATLLRHTADSPMLSHFPSSSGPDGEEPVLTVLSDCSQHKSSSHPMSRTTCALNTTMTPLTSLITDLTPLRATATEGSPLVTTLFHPLPLSTLQLSQPRHQPAVPPKGPQMPTPNYELQKDFVVSSVTTKTPSWVVNWSPLQVVCLVMKVPVMILGMIQTTPTSSGNWWELDKALPTIFMHIKCVLRCHSDNAVDQAS